MLCAGDSGAGVVRSNENAASVDATPPTASARVVRRRRRWPFVVLGAIVLLAAIGGLVVGRFLRFDLPDVRGLEDYDPPVMSRVMATDGSIAATFAEQRRTLIEFHDIPDNFRNALVAVEDSGFYRHPGIDLKGIARALWSDMRHLRLEQGASTITQQLARNLFLHPAKTWRRKAQEAVLALEIERQYTKSEILRFYCNQIYMGHGRYGLEAAARFYYGKPARELSLAESAMLAGLIQRPESLSPVRNPERALARRNHVLRRMVEEGYLDAAEAERASREPLGVTTAADDGEALAPYFVEEVRRWLQARYGSSQLYREGLEVETTLDPRLQEIANQALSDGLRELDHRQGWRGVAEHVPEGVDPTAWDTPRWHAELRAGDVVPGIVVAERGDSVRVRVAAHEGGLGPDEIGWTRSKSAARLFDVGDVIEVRIVALAPDGAVRLALEQRPVAQAALVALEPASGAVRALVGGFDFAASEYDRAMQARRQTGSAFKPFVFAAALAGDRTLADLLLDEPTVFLDRSNPEPYQPENYTNEYYELLTLRSALEKSANIATVKLLTEIGYAPVLELAHALGITTQLEPYPSLALGAFGISLLELTSAYGAFANQGVLVDPHLVDEVRDRDGVLVSAETPTVRDAVRPEVAYLMNQVLAGVIADGTGRAASALGLELAGKTGTTDDFTDAWFVGYSSELAVGVWVGFDERKSLGPRETGAVAALPIWTRFMQGAYADRRPAPFPVPAGMTMVAIDAHTGLKANREAGCTDVITEAFVAGTEPTRYCTARHHALAGFPYPFRRYPLDDNGALAVPSNELERLLAEETEVFLVDDGTRLEAHTAAGVFTLPLAVLPAVPDPADEPWIRERFDPDTWRGKDGRRARIVLLDRAR
jgi:penicillin-binding protein 1A